MRKTLVLCMLLAVAAFSISSPIYAAAKKPPCVKTMAKCPKKGCGGDPKLNENKNRKDSASSAKSMTVTEIVDMNSTSPKTWKSGADRKPLKDLGEGTAVEVTAYLINAHASGVEACNCRLPGVTNNDFHLNLVTDDSKTAPKKDLMKQSVVIEMSPRSRNAKWKLPTLQALATTRNYVRVTGFLMFDTAHVHFQSMPRASAWEIHPITKFEVCQGTKAECDAGSKWKLLETL